MEKSVIAEGKTSNEAIQNGLKLLGCKIDDVDVKVLENEDKKVFFSILDPRVVKVELTLKDSYNKNAKINSEPRKFSEKDLEICKKVCADFLDKFCSLYGDISYSISIDSYSVFIEISGDDSSKLIGYRGENINALQTLLIAISNNSTVDRVRVKIDICGYKKKREESLKELAVKLERTVHKSGKRVVLEPMTAYERKIIHTALQNSKWVKTHSIGEEPRRKIVVEKK